MLDLDPPCGCGDVCWTLTLPEAADLKSCHLASNHDPNPKPLTLLITLRRLVEHRGSVAAGLRAGQDLPTGLTLPPDHDPILSPSKAVHVTGALAEQHGSVQGYDQGPG